MENVIYLQHHKAKIDMHLKRQREQMADLTDKRDVRIGKWLTLKWVV